MERFEQRLRRIEAKLDQLLALESTAPSAPQPDGHGADL